MPSITSWFRLEPVGPADDVRLGVAARVADPLWLLARQWQVGEFQAEDGGTPIVARWRGTASPLTRLFLGPIPHDERLNLPRLPADGVPLETLIERQPDTDGLRTAVEAGAHFLRVLAQQATSADYGPGFRRAFAVQRPDEDAVAELDAASRGYLDLVAGRALDGRRLRAALAVRPLPDIGQVIAAADAAEVREACASWMSWYDSRLSVPAPGPTAWQPDRMEYAFSVAGRVTADPFDDCTLTAAEHGGGAVDWYSFDRTGDVNAGTTPGEAGPLQTQTVIPAPVTVRGVPAPRFWEMEDGLLDLGALQPGPTELAQLLMIEALSGYGNDWYLVGIDVPVGSLVSTSSLVVVDTFGAQTLLRPHGHPSTVGHRGWSMFSLAMPVEVGRDGVAQSNLLFLPPTLVSPLDGPVLEEVLLLRDELANLAWAVERRLESPLGVGLDAGSNAIGSGPPPDLGTPPVEVPTYQLASAVPPHWVPLLPLRTAPDSAEIRLARGAVLDAQAQPRVVTSRARLLGDPDSPLLIPEEEVPRAGAAVRQRFSAARGPDGRLHLWRANHKSLGRGEGSGGLRFDSLS